MFSLITWYWAFGYGFIYIAFKPETSRLTPARLGKIVALTLGWPLVVPAYMRDLYQKKAGAVNSRVWPLWLLTL